MNGDIKVFARYKWAGVILWSVFLAMAARTAWPWNDALAEVRTEREERKSADSVQLGEIHRLAASLEAHLAWADTTQRANLAGIKAAAEDIRAANRYDCLKAKRARDQYAWDMLLSAGVKCNDLLGNRMP